MVLLALLSRCRQRSRERCSAERGGTVFYVFDVKKRISSVCCDSSPLHTTPASFLTLSPTAVPIILSPHLVCLPLSEALLPLWSPGIRFFINSRSSPFYNSITLRRSLLPLFSELIICTLCLLAIFSSYIQIQ